MPNYVKTIFIAIVVVFLADYVRVQLTIRDESKGIGSLTVDTDTPDSLEAGTVHRFTSLTIPEGATLVLFGSKNAFTKIIVEKNFRLFGKIIVSNISAKDTVISDTITTTDYGTLELEHTYKLFSNGGKGGAGGRPSECHRSSCQRLDCFRGGNGKEMKGGCGGRGMSDREVVLCRDDRSCKDAFCYQKSKGGCGIEAKPDEKCYTCDYADNKEKKNITGKTDESPLTHGNGGDGGTMGNHGGLLYIQVGGFLDGTGGSIDLSGGNGNNGKDGENDKYTGGGGGGGGPGGNGGKLMILVNGEHTTLPRMNVDGGKGGKGGKGGVPNKTYGLSEYAGKPGSDGNKGKNGVAVQYNKFFKRWDRVK